MKLLHISDLHIGKRVGEFNMLEDQRHVLAQILDIAKAEQPSGILIAGDVYDKSVPSGEAVELLDELLTGFVSGSFPVFMISGNHDSSERLNFASRILEKNRLHIVGTFDGSLRKATLEDEFGPLNIYLLPYVKPALVRPYFEAPIESYDAALRAVTAAARVDVRERNVLIAHQFVTSGGQQPQRSESETIAVGGLDNVDASAFSDFDYVALGHIHGPQWIGRETIRYAGSPLKYSFSEARQHKSVTLLEFGAKGKLAIRPIPLEPLRDMREIKGPLAQLLRIGSQDRSGVMDYIHATLTDEDEILDAVGQLRQVYPNLMHLDFENSRTRENTELRNAASGDVARKSPLELFSEFYQNQNNSEMTPEQIRIMGEIFEEAGGVEA